MTKWKGLSAFHFSGNCGGTEGGGHSYTSLSSLLHSFLEQGCSSTNANLATEMKVLHHRQPVHPAKESDQMT